jgi:hypothetical protein
LRISGVFDVGFLMSLHTALQNWQCPTIGAKCTKHTKWNVVTTKDFAKE